MLETQISSYIVFLWTHVPGVLLNYFIPKSVPEAWLWHANRPFLYKHKRTVNYPNTLTSFVTLVTIIKIRFN